MNYADLTVAYRRADIIIFIVTILICCSNFIFSRHYIDNNLTHNITLTNMARHIFRSMNYVLRLFKDGYNKAPYE